jgi:hypothetical protein
MSCESWTVITSFYWVVTTIATVGYGDLKLTNDNSKLFLILFIPISVTLFVSTITLITLYNRQIRIDKHRQLLLKQKMNKHWMLHIHNKYNKLLNENLKIDKFTFVLSVLMDLSLIEIQDIQLILEVYIILCIYIYLIISFK